MICIDFDDKSSSHRFSRHPDFEERLFRGQDDPFPGGQDLGDPFPGGKDRGDPFPRERIARAPLEGTQVLGGLEAWTGLGCLEAWSLGLDWSAWRLGFDWQVDLTRSTLGEVGGLGQLYYSSWKIAPDTLHIPIPIAPINKIEETHVPV